MSGRRLGEPATNRELFLFLERDGWIASDLRGRLADMAAFRNVLVRGYDDMDLMIVRDVLTNHLGDLGCFAACITRKLKEDKDQAAATEPPRNA